MPVYVLKVVKYATLVLHAESEEELVKAVTSGTTENDIADLLDMIPEVEFQVGLPIDGEAVPEDALDGKVENGKLQLFWGDEDDAEPEENSDRWNVN